MTRFTKRGYSDKEKLLAVALYISGVSMNRIGKIIDVSCQTITRWIANIADKLKLNLDTNLSNENKEPKCYEIDEMCLYIKKKRKRIWLWKVYDRGIKKCVAWIFGDRSTETLENLINKIDPDQKNYYFTDKYRAYSEVLPYNRLIQSKSQTVAIERNNALQRNTFARFKRRSQVVSKSINMLNHTMKLFVYYQDKEKFNELLSLVR